VIRAANKRINPLSHLSRLRYVRLLHFPHASDLAPLARCRELETVSLESLPGWDSSGKVLGRITGECG